LQKLCLSVRRSAFKHRQPKQIIGKLLSLLVFWLESSFF